MKKQSICIVFLTLLISCNNNPDISGTWIEMDNFSNPIIMKYWDNKAYQVEGLSDDTVDYVLSRNYISYSNSGKIKYKFYNDTIAFSFEKNENYAYRFERFTNENYYDYLFEKIGIDINLPIGHGEYISYSSLNNFITLKTIDSTIYFSFDGKNIDFQNFTIDSDSIDFDWHRKLNLCFIDSNITMADVFKLEQVLLELNLSRFVYITKGTTSNNLTEVQGIKIYRRLLDTIPARLIYHDNYIKPPPLPPQLSFQEMIKNHKILYLELKNDKLFNNGSEIDFIQLQEKVNSLLTQNKKDYILLYHIDSFSTYASFIKLYSLINMTFTQVRDSVANKNYNANYQDLTSERQLSIRKDIPKYIVRLTDDELQYIKNTP